MDKAEELLNTLDVNDENLYPVSHTKKLILL